MDDAAGWVVLPSCGSIGFAIRSLPIESFRLRLRACDIDRRVGCRQASGRGWRRGNRLGTSPGRWDGPHGARLRADVGWRGHHGSVLPLGVGGGDGMASGAGMAAGGASGVGRCGSMAVSGCESCGGAWHGVAGGGFERAGEARAVRDGPVDPGHDVADASRGWVGRAGGHGVAVGRRDRGGGHALAAASAGRGRMAVASRDGVGVRGGFWDTLGGGVVCVGGDARARDGHGSGPAGRGGGVHGLRMGRARRGHGMRCGARGAGRGPCEGIAVVGRAGGVGGVRVGDGHGGTGFRAGGGMGTGEFWKVALMVDGTGAGRVVRGRGRMGHGGTRIPWAGDGADGRRGSVDCRVFPGRDGRVVGMGIEAGVHGGDAGERVPWRGGDALVLRGRDGWPCAGDGLGDFAGVGCGGRNDVVVCVGEPGAMGVRGDGMGAVWLGGVAVRRGGVRGGFWLGSLRGLVPGCAREGAGGVRGG